MDDRQREIMAEARRWFVRMRDDAVSAEERDGFTRWLAADAAHRAAFARAERLWSTLDAVTPVLRQREAWQAAKPARPPIAGLQMHRRAWMKRAAAAALVLGAGGYLAHEDGLLADHRTASGERRSIGLADGSRVELGGDTAVSLRYETAARRLRLHRGQAHFTVAPDRERPFTVQAGAITVTALGTAFDVKLNGADVQVTVTEHAVSVALPGQEPVRVAQGSQIIYAAGQLQAPQAVNLAAALSWRNDRLFFQDTPLQAVVQDLSRYRRGRIVIMDDAVAAIPVTGIFHTAQADRALETIGDTLPVQLSQYGGGWLTLIRAR